MPTPAKEEDPLEKFWDNREAINLIKELHGVSEDIAEELWHRFMGTVRRMKSIAQSEERPSS